MGAFGDTEVKAACGTDQVCVGLEAGIEGLLHSIQLHWTDNHEHEDYGFLLVDAYNAFNEGNRL